MKMTPAVLVFGSLIIFASVLFDCGHSPVDDHQRPALGHSIGLGHRSKKQGRSVYIQNGCTYCHTQFIRNIDWDLGAEGSPSPATTCGNSPICWAPSGPGPDLSQEGGEHPDDWHVAHFVNPRFTRPESIMPQWEFLGMERSGRSSPTSRAWDSGWPTTASSGKSTGRRRPSKAYEAGPERMWRGSTANVPETLDEASQSVPHDGGGPEARPSDLPEVLHRLSRPHRRRHGAGSALSLSRLPSISRFSRTGASQAASSTIRS